MPTYQAPHAVIMIRPTAFGFNEETAESNIFQQVIKENDLQSTVKNEFDGVINTLKASGIEIELFDDLPSPATPDAIFPNNWFFTLPTGEVILCPMLSKIRREERRMDIISYLQDNYAVSEVIDLTGYEKQEKFLEGTGSIIFNHTSKKAFATISSRTDEHLFEEICQRIGYEPYQFMSRDESGNPIYHTNVMLSIGSNHVIVCLDAVHPADHNIILEQMADDDLKVIAISYKQMQEMAGNVLEVQTNRLEDVLIMSNTAVESLLPGQLDAISKLTEIVTVDIPTIEKVGGGGIRCMLAGNHLPVKG